MSLLRLTFLLDELAWLLLKTSENSSTLSSSLIEVVLRIYISLKVFFNRILDLKDCAIELFIAKVELFWIAFLKSWG